MKRIWCSVEISSVSIWNALRLYMEALGVKFSTGDCSVGKKWIKHVSLYVNREEQTQIDFFLTTLYKVEDDAVDEYIQSVVNDVEK